MPRRIASAMSSPVPRLLACSGSSSSRRMSVRPLAAALSMTADGPDGPSMMPYCVSTSLPSGSWASMQTVRPPRAAVSTAAKPSPPSETGRTTHSCPAKPSATAEAASAEDRQPLNESVAIITFIVSWSASLSWQGRVDRQHMDRNTVLPDSRRSLRACQTPTKPSTA